eukprot:jgi/Orpsp1_1/1179492/evm.model.c7180000069529.1
MKQTAHSVNSSKNLLLVNNNRENNTESSNGTYSHITTPEEKSIHNLDDIQNQSYNFNTLNSLNRTTNQNNISFNNNSLIINTLNNTATNNNLLINN